MLTHTAKCFSFYYDISVVSFQIHDERGNVLEERNRRMLLFNDDICLLKL